MFKKIKRGMEKIGYLLKESMHLVRKHKLYALAPLLIVLALLGFLFYHSGPAVVISFIYAGV